MTGEEYGGVDAGSGRLTGGTAVYLGDDFRSVLTAVVNIDARGRVGGQELAFARKVGLEVIDVRPADQRYR